MVPGRSQWRARSPPAGRLPPAATAVGIAGEGGMITRVLVDAGTWVGSGKCSPRRPLGPVAGSGAAAASIQVARADSALAQNELNAPKHWLPAASVRADVDRRRAARDAASARGPRAQAQYAATRAASAGSTSVRRPPAWYFALGRGRPVVGAGPARCSASRRR